jgi:hypothetical protein
MRLAYVLLLVLLGLNALSCGDTSEKGPVRVGQAFGTSKHSEEAPVRNIAHPALGQRYLNDGDRDPTNDEDSDDIGGKKVDEDNDLREDHLPVQNQSYHDGDDDLVRFGEPASAADRRAITSVFKRYQAAAVAEDGVTACHLLYSSFAEAIPEDYGQPPGPSYLRGGKTCQAVMTMLFRHSHDELTSAFDVTGVRVVRNQGVALLGSRKAPASYLDMRRERDVWKVGALIAAPVP